MANEQIFQFTLSPVQGFVAQARRTRDFWAGSFILSWLSSVAMEAIMQQKGTIQFPVPDPLYLDALRGQSGSQAPLPEQGSIPNRFMATTAVVPAGFMPEAVADAVQRAWQALADVVWQHDLAPMAVDSPGTQKVWERQVRHFWEISWVLSDAQEPALLERRKAWRNHVLPDEPGHKCMMMDGWQELSGVEDASVQDVRQFWQRVRQQKSQPSLLHDLREGEQLCAMAFIKRRFARYFEKVECAVGHESADALHRVGGWTLPTSVPSVAFMAAAPWIASMLDKADDAALAAFYTAASALVDDPGKERAQVAEQGRTVKVGCVARAARARADRDGAFRAEWAGLDGQLYFASTLDNDALFADAGVAADTMQERLRTARSALAELQKCPGVGQPSPFYAVLLMDGDQLGKHMGRKEAQLGISQALNAFTREVPELVRRFDGFLVYAGGDDVLALLPMAQALPAAAALQACYRRCFKSECRDVPSTLSGAIEYAHIRAPLTQVLQDAHHLLDEVAKDQVGRNAVAVRVWRRAGMALEWSMPWEKALPATQTSMQGQPQPDPEVEIDRLARDFASLDGAEEQVFSSKFFFRFQEIVERFPDADLETLQSLVWAEWLHSWDGRHEDESARKTLELLLQQCTRWQRPEPGVDPKPVAPVFNPDGALLVRFLASQGQERQWQ